MNLKKDIDHGTPESLSQELISLEIDGHQVVVPEGTSIMRAAKQLGTSIPKLCATDSLEAFGSCRLCLVEIEGRRGTPASCTTPVESGMIVHTQTQKLAKLRKGVMELARLLEDEGDITLVFGQNHIRAAVADFTFTSKLVDGKFPDYNRVLPKGGNKVILGDCQALKQGFTRASILSNEKYRGVRVVLTNGELRIFANNPEQEEAEEVVAVDYQGDELEMGFNVSYLIDVLSTLRSSQAKITLLDANSSALIESGDESNAMYVVMPMRL